MPEKEKLLPPILLDRLKCNRITVTLTYIFKMHYVPISVLKYVLNKSHSLNSYYMPAAVLNICIALHQVSLRDSSIVIVLYMGRKLRLREVQKLA